LEEPLDETGAPHELGMEHLDGDPGAEDGVLRLEHGSHTAVAQGTDDAVLAVDDAADPDHRADQRSTLEHAEGET
jgi:hypothetical protein